MFKRVKKIWKTLGPGLITGAADNDPSGIANYSIAGAQTGYNLLWTMVLILPFMIAIQEMSARIGALSGCGLAGNMKRYYSKWLLGIAAITIIFANVFNIGSDIYGMAGALNLVLPISVRLCAILISILVVILITKLRYRQIANIFKWLSLSMVAYVIAFFFSHPNGWDIIHYTLIPHIEFNRGYIFIAFALLGTTISPYLYFWQASEEAEEFSKGRDVHVCKFKTVTPGKLQRIDRDTIAGMTFSNIASFFIIALAGSTLFGHGNISTLEQAASALKPLLGQYAYIVFTLGIIGSGLLAIPILAGSAAYVLAELFNWEGSLDDKFSQAHYFYLAISGAVLLGLLIPFLGITPLQSLFYSGLLNGIISPFLILLIIHMANNPAIVGPYRSKTSFTWLAYGSFIFMLAGTIFVFIS